MGIGRLTKVCVFCGSSCKVTWFISLPCPGTIGGNLEIEVIVVDIDVDVDVAATDATPGSDE